MHIAAGGRRFAIVETKTVDTSVVNLTPAPYFRFQYPNVVGSACLELDVAAAIISYEEYYPYGGSAYCAGDAQKRYRYAARERDVETGLYCLGVRYYAPWIARWISCDPGGPIDGFNLYEYARSSPVRYADPSGFQSNADNQVPSMQEPEMGPDAVPAAGDDSTGQSDDDNQISLPLLSLTNAAFQGQYPVPTKRTAFQSNLTVTGPIGKPGEPSVTFTQGGRRRPGCRTRWN